MESIGELIQQLKTKCPHEKYMRKTTKISTEDIQQMHSSCYENSDCEKCWNTYGENITARQWEEICEEYLRNNISETQNKINKYITEVEINSKILEELINKKGSEINA